MQEIIFLRSKQYGYLSNDRQSLKSKGTTKAVIRYDMKYAEMKSCLKPNTKDIYKSMFTLNNDKHAMYKK
jgi:hypothetical protein